MSTRCQGSLLGVGAAREVAIAVSGTKCLKLHAGNSRVRGSSGYKVEVWRDQRSTAHDSCVIDRLRKRRLFQSLAIKQLALNSGFRVVNALVINHW